MHIGKWAKKMNREINHDSEFYANEINNVFFFFEFQKIFLYRIVWKSSKME